MNHDSSPAPRGPLPPVVLFTAMAIMVAVHFVVPFVHRLASFWRVAVGALMLGVGVLLNLWADSLVTRAGTAVNPFEPSSALMEGGPFAFSRHPMYLGMVLILTGIALALGSLLPWLVIPVIVWHMTRRFIIAEERTLEATFGPRYRAYTARVRRWW